MLSGNMEDNTRDSPDIDRGGGGLAGDIQSGVSTPQPPAASTPTPGAAASTNGNTASQTADPQPILDHIHRLLPLLIDADPTDLNRSLSGSNSLDVLEKLRRFAQDPQVPVLFAIKEISANAGATANGDAETPLYTYTLHEQITYSETHISSLAIIKRSSTIDSSRPLQQQLQIINLPGVGQGNPYETLHAYIHNAVAPFFDAYVSSRSGIAGAVGGAASAGDKDGKTGIPMTKKKIAELELSLLHLQQNVEIPEINLHIHPIVRQTIQSCREQGKRLTIDVLDQNLLQDSSFLNRIQSDVNGWIKEIQKVTKLSRDPASGTASQEINFWLSMERALAGIEEQLKGEEIVFTMDVLRHAKRFHATVSFLADTGLKESMDNVGRWNQLMKDFPVNELLSAGDVGKVREAVVLIFGHINKKLKLSHYPIRRALPLVEAISRDLNDQLLKCLGGRKLMYMSYEEFEKAAEGCERVFRTWDEQVKEFTNLAREVTRKRSEKFLPIKVLAVHGRLQERVEFLRGFRRGHEQLYVTILRVMRPEKG
ncbi:hypothetical protein HK097_010869, partial [Rhizophlyctis rosea]